MKDFYFKRLPDRECDYLSESLKNVNFDPENYADFEVQNCWSYGPLTVCIRQEGQKIRAYFHVYGVKVGSATLLKTKPCAGWAYDKDPIKIEIKLCADFNKRTVTIEGKICVFVLCQGFRQLIFRW